MQQTFAKLRAFPARLATTIAAVPDDKASLLEAEGKWSVADVVAHLADLELIYAVRIRTIVAGAGETPIVALDQNAWVERVHRREPLGELLDQFTYLRHMNLALLERLSDEEIQRSGIHPQYGPITPAGAAVRLMSHDEKHLQQIERVKSAVLAA